MVRERDLVRMTLEVLAGLEQGDPRSLVPDTPEHRAAWRRLARQVRDLLDAGWTVDLPKG